MKIEVERYGNHIGVCEDGQLALRLLTPSEARKVALLLLAMSEEVIDRPRSYERKPRAPAPTPQAPTLLNSGFADTELMP